MSTCEVLIEELKDYSLIVQNYCDVYLTPLYKNPQHWTITKSTMIFLLGVIITKKLRCFCDSLE